MGLQVFFAAVLLLAFLFQNSGLVAIPIAFFHAGAFVVFFLAFGQGDFAFDELIFPIQFG